MAQAGNIEIAQRLLAGIGEAKDPEALARMFAEDLRFEVQGDDGVLPWIGRKTGRQAVVEFLKERDVLTEPVRLAVEDVVAGTDRAVIVGSLASRIKSTGKVCESQFAIVLTVSDGTITRFQMLEDSFNLSRAARS